MIMFIYNLIKCYVRSPTEEIPEGLKNYSKELQNITAVEDDAVLDLSQAS